MSVPELAVDQDRLREVCTRYGVARLEIFGSVARGEAEAESDIDLLYELEPNASLGWDIEMLSSELTELLGRPVDLVSRSSLHELLRDEGCWQRRARSARLAASQSCEKGGSA